MITSLFQRDLTIFYRTHRATMNAGNTLNARIGPFRFSVTRQGNRTGRTDLRTDAARDTGIRSIKSVAAYRKVSEQRIDHIALQKRDTSRIIQRGISLLPDRLYDLAYTFRRFFQFLSLYHLTIHVEAGHQDIIVRHLYRESSGYGNSPPRQDAPHDPIRISTIITTSTDEINLLPLISGQDQPGNKAGHQYSRPPRMDREHKKHFLPLPQWISILTLIQRIGNGNQRLIESRP